MNRDRAITILKQHASELRRAGVTGAYLFGSVVHNTMGPDSDVDVLIDLDHTPTLFELARIRLMLEKWLGIGVDLGLRDSVREPLRERIYGELVRAA